MNEAHLAWHETLELHELVAFQSVGLVKLKQTYPHITNNDLKTLYNEAIATVEENLQELIEFFPNAPRGEKSPSLAAEVMTGFYAGDLLGFAKTSVRNYAIAITETATPMVREVLQNQLNNAIELHAKTFHFMYERSDYPAYNLERLLQTDLENAYYALSM